MFLLVPRVGALVLSRQLPVRLTTDSVRVLEIDKSLSVGQLLSLSIDTIF